MAKCRGCEAEILWCRTTKGKWMPIDKAPNPKGNLVITDERGPNGETMVATPDLFTDGDKDRYMPHWATCPAHGDFR